MYVGRTQHPIAYLVLSLVSCLRAEAQNYLVDLGPGTGVAINNSGQVALENSFYSNGTLTPLPSGMTAAGINNNGAVVGTIITQGSTPCGPPVQLQSVVNVYCAIAVYSDGQLTQYPVNNPDAPDPAANWGSGINDSGTVVGVGAASPPTTPLERWLIWGVPPGLFSWGVCCGNMVWPLAINDAGQILVNLPETASVPGALVVTSLTGSPSGLVATSISLPLVQGYAINANGSVAGYTTITTGTSANTVTQQLGAIAVAGDGGYTPYASAPTITALYGLNDDNFGVGDGPVTVNGTSLMHAFLCSCESDGFSDLNSLIAPTDPLQPYVTLVHGVGINDSGLVLANGVDSRTGVQHAYLLQVPLVQVGPCCDVYNLPNTAVGKVSAPQSATFTNRGLISIALGAVSTSANFPVQSNTCTGSLAPGATCAVSITFGPTEAGTTTGQLTLLVAGFPLNVPESGIGAPFKVSLHTSATSVSVGTPFTLTWTASPGTTCKTYGGAVAYGDPPDGWSGPLPSTGMMTIMEKETNTYTFGVTCSASLNLVQAAYVAVIVTQPAPSSGGGGALDWVSELLLFALLVRRVGRRERVGWNRGLQATGHRT